MAQHAWQTTDTGSPTHKRAAFAQVRARRSLHSLSRAHRPPPTHTRRCGRPPAPHLLHTAHLAPLPAATLAAAAQPASTKPAAALASEATQPASAEPTATLASAAVATAALAAATLAATPLPTATLPTATLTAPSAQVVEWAELLNSWYRQQLGAWTASPCWARLEPSRNLLGTFS